MAVRKWKHYFLERHFTVHIRVWSIKDGLNGCWVLILISFINQDVRIKLLMDYREACLWILCCLLLTVPTVLQWQDMFHQIVEDDGIHLMIKKLLAKEGVVSGKLIVRDGKLCSKKRLVIPKSSKFIPFISLECHDGKAGGHSGVLKRLRGLINHLFWEGLKKQVQDYIAEC